ncbi:MAG: hypothetical protein JST80_02685 [Bdellovibrionales bacterium]|nr:hypothetical protein [Bdellovibrionales bacterium]
MMKTLLVTLLTFGALTASAGTLSCFVSGDLDKVQQTFNGMTVLKGENEVAKYTVMANEESIVSMKIVDLRTNTSADLMGISYKKQLPSLRLKNDRGETIQIDCALKD